MMKQLGLSELPQKARQCGHTDLHKATQGTSACHRVYVQLLEDTSKDTD
jgi:hypothetical protein